jgi:hypothetical protein
MDAAAQARRLRAMRELGGFRSGPALARAMRDAGYVRGFQPGTIKNWETEDHEQTIPPEKVALVAQVCGLPEEFFYADFNDVAKISPDREARIRARLSDAAERERKRRAGSREGLHAPGREDRSP